MKLVNSDEPLYIPVTQEPVPKTEDQLEDDAELMLKLGPDNSNCFFKYITFYKIQVYKPYDLLDLRVQMMSASLLSDMASFKAANVNGTIEDFIRWYSPRDWIESEDSTGTFNAMFLC